MNPFNLESIRQLEIRRLRDVASLHGYELVGKREIADLREQLSRYEQQCRHYESTLRAADMDKALGNSHG